MSGIVRGAGLGCVLALLACGNAFGLTGSPVVVATPQQDGPPSVAVGSDGTAYIAWANTKDLSPNTTNVVQYCSLPVGAHTCSHTATLVPSDGIQFIDGVQVLVDGSTIIVLADVFGNTPNHSDYEPLEEWQSTDGANFTPVSGGKGIAEGVESSDTQPAGGVVVPGTGELGFGWVTAGASPSFNAFPLVSPPECSVTTTPQCPFATLEPITNPDQLSNQPSHLASQAGADPGILGVFFADFTNGPLGCSNAQTTPFSMTYAFATGNQSPANDYNVSPGQPNSAWKVPLTLGDCNVDYITAAGGPSGFGVLEQDTLHGTTVYHPFDQHTMSFDGPRFTVSDTKEQSPALSQDAAGDLYATYLQDGAGSPIVLSYSPLGGFLWRGPSVLSPDSDQAAADVTSSVSSVGQGWVVWNDNGSVVAQSFQAADATPSPTAITTSQTSGTTTGALLTVPAGTTDETDQAALAGLNAAAAGGTVNYTLYSAAGCAASSKVFSSSVTVTGGHVAASSPVAAALSAGRYYWQAAYSGDGFNAAATSACGAERLTVKAPAAVGGTATSTSSSVTVTVSCAKVPCTLTLTITVKGTTIAKGTVTLRKKGRHKIKLKLTHRGRKFRKHHHGTVKGKLTLHEKIQGHLVAVTTPIKIKPLH